MHYRNQFWRALPALLCSRFGYCRGRAAWPLSRSRLRCGLMERRVSEARRSEAEKADIGPGKCNVTNVHNPSITPYLPTADKATGAAIVIAPGGGHRMLCLGHEGNSLGEWFAEHGIAAFVLKYRLAREPDSKYTVDEHAMADMRRAIRLVRSRSAEWHIKPDRIGVLGFSAGGELAALAAMQSDSGQPDAADTVERASCRPDFQVLIYPGSSNRFTVEPGMPPVFIALGAKDRPDISLGMAQLYLKYRRREFLQSCTFIPTQATDSVTGRNRNRPMVPGRCDCASGWSTAS